MMTQVCTMITELCTVITELCTVITEFCAVYNRFFHYCFGLIALESANHSRETFPCILLLIINKFTYLLSLFFEQQILK